MIEAMNAERSVLVLVDYQQRLMPAIAEHDTVLAHAGRLADIASLLAVPVVGTEQNPAGLGPNVEPIRARCEATMTKTHFDACADGLTGHLITRQGEPAREIVIAGCEAHVCLAQTALGLLRAGYSVRVVAQACGSRSADDRDTAMLRLRQAGADIVGIEMVAFEWLRNCEHPRFREVLRLLK